MAEFEQEHIGSVAVGDSMAAFEVAYPELYWHIAKGKICAGEPLYGAIIYTGGGTEMGDGESSESADEAFRMAVADAGLMLPALSRPAQEPVAVKPLEWRTDRTAKAFGATWMVWPYTDPLNDGNGRWMWQCVGAHPHASGRFHTEAEAFAAAQDDYQQRILSTLSAAPQPVINPTHSQVAGTPGLLTGTAPSAQPPVGWVNVRVEDTGDGLIINPDDALKWRLRDDQAYEGHFLPDGTYRIAIPAQPPAVSLRVTDEMIEAACAAHWVDPWPGDRSQPALKSARINMRAALEAALAASEGSTE